MTVGQPCRGPGRPCDCDVLIARAAAHYDVTVDTLTSDTRTSPLAQQREVAIAACHVVNGCGRIHIAERFIRHRTHISWVQRHVANTPTLLTMLVDLIQHVRAQP